MSSELCNEFDKKIWFYFDGTLSESERAEFDRHLSSCVVCRNHVEFIKRTLDLYDDTVTEKPDDLQFERALQYATSKQSRERQYRKHKKLITIAVLAASVLLGVFLFYEKTPNRAYTWTQMEWETQLTQIDSTIDILNTHGYSDYNDDETTWSEEIQSIEQQIAELEIEITKL
jgi:hypothetical protein